jgi:hypothetical protein
VEVLKKIRSLEYYLKEKENQCHLAIYNLGIRKSIVVQITTIFIRLAASRILDRVSSKILFITRCIIKH